MRVPISESEVLKIPPRQPEEAVAVLYANKIDNSPSRRKGPANRAGAGESKRFPSAPGVFPGPSPRFLLPQTRAEGCDARPPEARSFPAQGLWRRSLSSSLPRFLPPLSGRSRPSASNLLSAVERKCFWRKKRSGNEFFFSFSPVQSPGALSANCIPRVGLAHLRSNHCQGWGVGERRVAPCSPTK